MLLFAIEVRASLHPHIHTRPINYTIILYRKVVRICTTLCDYYNRYVNLDILALSFQKQNNETGFQKVLSKNCNPDSKLPNDSEPGEDRCLLRKPSYGTQRTERFNDRAYKVN